MREISAQTHTYVYMFLSSPIRSFSVTVGMPPSGRWPGENHSTAPLGSALGLRVAVTTTGCISQTRCVNTWRIGSVLAVARETGTPISLPTCAAVGATSSSRGTSGRHHMLASRPSSGRITRPSLPRHVTASAHSESTGDFARFFGAGRDMIVLFGVSQFFLFQALIALLQLVADAEDAQQIVFWQVGDITRAGWAEVGIVTAALALTLPFSQRAVWRLTVLRTGEAQAAALGVDVERLRVVTVLRFSALTTIAVCFVGAIGFVGLVGPHLARLTLGEDHRFLTPGSALFGMLLLSLAALLAKLLIPGAITPVGVLTSIIGAPALIYLLILRRPS